LSEVRVQFESFSEFLAMGHHGLYVWLAYGIALVVIIGNWILPIVKRKNTLKTLARTVQREQARAQQKEPSS
jgi:heme exporter protein D